MARICSKTPWMKTWSLPCVLLVEKTAVSEGICGKGRDQSEKGDFEAYMGKKYACSPKALYQAMCRDPQYQDWGADLGVPGTGEVSRDGAGAAYKSSSLSKRGILPYICIREVLGDEFAASEGTAAERRAGIYSVLAWGHR